MTSEKDPIQSDSKWKNATVLWAPSETAQSISPMAVGDTFSVQFQLEGTRQGMLNCNMLNGDGPLVKLVTVVMQLHLNLDNVDVNEIDLFDIQLEYGIQKSPRSQAQLLCNFEGTTKSVEYRFGEAQTIALQTLVLEVPATALQPERLSRPTLLISAFAQREDSDNFFIFVVDDVAVSIRGRL